MDIQTFVAERAVEALDECIVRGLARTAEVDPRTLVISPHVHQTAREFCAVVCEQVSGLAALGHQSVQCFHDMFASEANADINRQRFTGIDVQLRSAP